MVLDVGDLDHATLYFRVGIVVPPCVFRLREVFEPFDPYDAPLFMVLGGAHRGVATSECVGL
jgi:hypothetical protein